MTKSADWTAVAAATDRTLPTGTRIDDYEIEQTLREGGVAIVYRAFDHALGMQVAVEEYMPEAMALRSVDGRVVLRTRAQGRAFDAGRQAFIGEAQTLARCEHPALLRIDRVLQRNGTVYRTMRLPGGPTLLEYRRALAGSPDAATLQRWLEELLGALAALHADGCVHSALAPGRIVVRDGARLLLLDFDAVRATLISERTQEMMAALEPCFAAPELRRASPAQAIGPWTDLYALATTLRFAIDGELPPPATGLAAAHPAGLVSEAWRRAAPDGAGDLAWLRALDACLVEAPHDRPQSVAQLRRMIDEAVFASSVPAWPAPPIAPPTPETDDDVAPDDGASAATSGSDDPAPEARSPVAEASASDSLTHDAAAAPATAGTDDPARAPAEAELHGFAEPEPDPAAADVAVAEATVAQVMADLDETLARAAPRADGVSESDRAAAAVAPATLWSSTAATTAPATNAAADPMPAESAPAAVSGKASTPAFAPASTPMPTPAPVSAATTAAPATSRTGPKAASVQRELRALWQQNTAVWIATAVAAVMLVTVWYVQDRRSMARLTSGDASSAVRDEASPSLPVARPPVANAAAPDSHATATRRPAAPPAATAVAAGTEAKAGGGTTAATGAAQAAAAQTTTAPPTTTAPAAPAAPAAQSHPPTHATAAPQRPPRAQCGTQSGYELYQCLQTQCAKRAYVKHPQCVRLKRNQSLN